MKRHSKTRSYALLTSCSLAALALAAVPVSVDYSLEDGVVLTSQHAYASGGGEGGESGERSGGGEGGESGESGGGEGGEHGSSSSAGEGGESGSSGGEGGEHGGATSVPGTKLLLFPKVGSDDGTPDQGTGDN